MKIKKKMTRREEKKKGKTKQEKYLMKVKEEMEKYLSSRMGMKRIKKKKTQ